MRIAVVSDLLRANGAGIMALAACDLLHDDGHEVIALAGAMHADLESSLRRRIWAAEAFTHDDRSLDGSVTTLDHAAFLRAFDRWFEAQLSELRPDLLYVHNCGRVFDQRQLADLSRRIPVAHTMHDEWFYTDAHYTYRIAPEAATVRTYEPGRAERFVEHRYDHLFDVPGRIGRFAAIAPSSWLAERARRVFPSLDIHHVPNAVDTTRFELQDRTEARRLLGLPADRPLVLFVGSPTQERKGFQVLEQAMRTIAEPSPVRLVVGGSASVVTDGFASSIAPGPVAELLARPAPSPLGALGVRGDALVLSGLDRTLIPALYGAADVLVHPSLIDNLPTVPIEAGLCGTRCLASDVGGTRETIADTDDLFEIDEQPEVIGRHISQAIDAAANETTEDRSARRDRQLERFSVDEHRSLLLDVFHSLVGEG